MRGLNLRSQVRARQWHALLAISLLACLAPLLQAQVPGDVVAYWKLESLSDSTVATDETGQNNGTTVNGPAWTPVGRIGRALTFDGVNDKVQITSPVSLQQDAFAISAWVRYTATGQNGGEVATMGDSYALRVQPSGDVKTFFYNGSTWNVAQSAGINTKDGEWHHIVGQYSGSLGSPAYHLQVYVDGALKDDKTFSGQSIVPRGSSFILGQQGTGGTLHNFNGTMDQVRVYPRALTLTEVSALYAEAPAVDPKVFTVLTWNTQKGKNTSGIVNLETIADKIIITGTDVALLSAVNNQSQVDAIKARLGVKWTCTFYQITTEGQAICSKYPLTNPDHHDVNVSGQTEPQAIVKATVTIGGRPVSFFAIDAQHDPSGQDNSEVRRLQAVDMSAWADSGVFAEPRIVGGDFNEASGNGLNEWMTTYYDAWPNAALPFGYTTNSDGRTRSSRLDHILSSRGAGAIVENPPFVEGRVWDMRDFGTACTAVTTRIGSAGCSVCSSSPPPSNSVCGLIDNTAVRPSDHIPFTMKFRFVQ